MKKGTTLKKPARTVEETPQDVFTDGEGAPGLTDGVDGSPIWVADFVTIKVWYSVCPTCEARTAMLEEEPDKSILFKCKECDLKFIARR